jgi:Secretion system C-terminal sorting domain
MKTTITSAIILINICSFNSAISCDTIYVTMITHLYLGGPQAIEWDLEDEGNGLDIIEGEHNFSVDDSILTYTACLDTGCYRARARFDFEIDSGMFEIWVTLNGDTLPVYDDIDYGDDDYKYYFSLHSFCEDDDVSIIDSPEISKIYPNPADQFIHLEHPYLTIGSFLEILDQNGRIVFHQKVIDPIVHMDCSDWPNGSYIIWVKRDNYQSIIASKTIVSH